MYLESDFGKWKSQSILTRCDECNEEYKAKISTAERQSDDIGHHQCRRCSSRRAGKKTANKMAQIYSDRWRGELNPMSKTECREKISNALKGRTLSEEHKQALRKPKSKTDEIKKAANRPEEIARRRKRGLDNNVAKRLEVREKISNTISNLYISGFYRQNRYLSGYVETNKTIKPIWCRSGLEQNFIKQVSLIDEISIVESAECLRIPYVFDGITKHYLPDFKLTTKDGNVFIIEIKSSYLYNLAKECAKRQALKEFCEIENFCDLTLTEKDIQGWLEQLKG